jgi:ribosomal protein L37AE/L43A
MNAPQPKPPCPRCGRKKTVPHDGDCWYCPGCQSVFDNDPDEGGDYFQDPTKRIQRQEERRGRR